jgi:hypothetical protein
MRERRQTGAIATSSVVFVVMGSMVTQGVAKKDIKAAAVLYQVQTYTNEERDSRCELCCGWGHIENKSSSKPRCAYCSGHDRKSDHKCNMVGFTAEQGSLEGRMLEKCPKCKRNYIGFSSRCVMKRTAAEAAQQSRKIGLARQAPTSAARDMPTSSDIVVLGSRPLEVAEGGGDEEEMVDVDDEEEEAAGEARDITMAETETEATTRTATDTETEIETGALASND